MASVNDLLERERDGKLTDAERGAIATLREAGQFPGPLRAASDVGTAEGMGRAFVQGGTFGFGDELVAAGVATRNALTGEVDRSWSDVYDASLAAERERVDTFREESPVLAYGSEFLGAIPTAIATGGGANIARGAPLAGRMAAQGGIGAAQGAVYGFGAGEGGAEERAGSAALSGGIGAGIGALAPAIASGVRNVAGRVLSGRAAQGAGTTNPALNMALRAGEADDVFGGAGAQRIADAGDDAMLADAGTSFRELLDTAIARSGPAASAARRAIDDRVRTAGERIMQALDTAFGQPAGLRQTETALRRGTASVRNDAYQAAYAQPIDYASDTGRQIETIVQTRVPKEAIDAANRLMRAELGRGSQQIMAEVAEDGTVTFRSMPDVQQLDYITRGLNEVAYGPNGQTSPLGRIYGDLSRDIRDLVKEAVPEYKVALATAAEPIRARNALSVGSTALRTSTTRDELAEQLSRMSDAERTFVAQGIRAQIDDALANVARTLTSGDTETREAIKALRDLSTRAAREKVALVLGNDAANELFRTLDQATAAFELRAGVATNSRTFGRGVVDEQIRAQTEDGVVNALRSGQPANATQRVIQGLLGRTAEDKGRIADETYSALVDLLTTPRGQDALTALLRLDAARGTIQPQVNLMSLAAQRAIQSGAAPAGAAVTNGLMP